MKSGNGIKALKQKVAIQKLSKRLIIKASLKPPILLKLLPIFF
jgi:hypothetical protein